MALQQDIPGTLGQVIPNVYWVVGEIHILPTEGTAALTAHGFESKAEWENVKTIRALKAKQEADQAAWRIRRTAWETAHTSQEPFEEPEPFEQIPLMPLFIQSSLVVLPIAEYLALEKRFKGEQLNLWGVVYEVLKPHFEGSQSV